ncbi:hypothetical protein FGADI_5 [Fusarium gaditjirri]|uniref:Uncharacterized protein n=1 Tax=Fusarium gaditjirri TaxID=282569 RepID=A0A8H4TPJ2_9HYPO|nr:hypothetical protein FGADI_5 [Fusarium gaditjirri]
MAPYKESEKPEKFTTRIGAEHGRVRKPLPGAPRSKTRPSSPSSPGATEEKIKEVASPSATNLLPRRPTPPTTKSLGDSPRCSDPQPYTAAWAPPNANPSQPYQPPAVPYQPPPVPFTYPAAPNRYLNPSEVSGAQNSISQLRDIDQLKWMLEKYQAIAHSIIRNAEQLDRMIASVLGPLPQARTEVRRENSDGE